MVKLVLALILFCPSVWGEGLIDGNGNLKSRVTWPGGVYTTTFSYTSGIVGINGTEVARATFTNVASITFQNVVASMTFTCTSAITVSAKKKLYFITGAGSNGEYYLNCRGYGGTSGYDQANTGTADPIISWPDAYEGAYYDVRRTEFVTGPLLVGGSYGIVPSQGVNLVGGKSFCESSFVVWGAGTTTTMVYPTTIKFSVESGGTMSGKIVCYLNDNDVFP